MLKKLALQAFQIRYVYIMRRRVSIWDLQWSKMYKVGISSSPKQRALSIKKDYAEKGGIVFEPYVVFSAPFPFAEWVEKQYHQFQSRHNVRNANEVGLSGNTEWFDARGCNLFGAVFLALIVAIFGLLVGLSYTSIFVLILAAGTVAFGRFPYGAVIMAGAAFVVVWAIFGACMGIIIYSLLKLAM